MEQSVYKCPVCGAGRFHVTAHVTQDWLVDEKGSFLETVSSCEEITHNPDGDDLWTCAVCGYEASGKEFETKEMISNTLKIYNLPVEWSVYDTIEVAAPSLNAAVTWLKANQNTIPPGENPKYVNGSFHLDDGEDGNADTETAVGFLIGMERLLAGEMELERDLKPGEIPRFGMTDN